MTAAYRTARPHRTNAGASCALHCKMLRYIVGPASMCRRIAPCPDRGEVYQAELTPEKRSPALTVRAHPRFFSITAEAEHNHQPGKWFIARVSIGSASYNQGLEWLSFSHIPGRGGNPWRGLVMMDTRLRFRYVP
jgi:hypothetical protein